MEGEYITGVDISSERSDQITLIPLLERMRAHTGDVTCDTCDESEENDTYIENCTTFCYIKSQNYERSKTKKFKNNMALRENLLAMALNIQKYHNKIQQNRTGMQLHTKISA